MSAIIFNGPLLRALKAAIRLNDQATIWSGSADPTVTATFGRQGDLYIKFGASPAFYQKVTADGTDTNWTQGAPLAANVVDGSNIRLHNDQELRARNAANNGDVDILKVNTSDRILFASVPQVASDPVAGNDLARLSYIATQLGLKISSTEKGANNGVATLDAGGKVPVSQLPASVMTYEGTWNASTNTPTLADGTGDAGMIYLVSVAGTQNLGSGAITFAAGDWVVYSGAIWQKSVNSNLVASVNGQTGAVVLTSADISEVTNLYFTDERAQDAVGGIVANTTTINLSYNDGTPSISGVVNADSLTNTHINTAAAIAYSKLNLATSIVNGDIATGAAIAVSKLAALTASKAVATDSSGFLVAASTTAAELDFVSGVTSAIQTQLNGKQATLTPGSISTTTTGVTVGSGSSSTVGPNVTVDVQTASGSQPGLLSSTDWTTFNSKQSTVSFDAIGATPNANGGSISSGVVTLQPADATFGGVLTNTTQSIAGLKTFLNNLNVSYSNNGLPVIVGSVNTSATAGSDAHTRMVVASGGGDPHSLYTVTGVQSWAAGIDQSDSSKFKVSVGASLGTTDALIITTAGVLNIPNLTASLPVKTDASKNLVSAAIDLASAEVTGIVPMAKGGTNKNITASAGAVAYSDADSLELTAVGTSGQVLQSNGTSAPSWVTLSAAIPTIFGSRGTPRSIVAATGITSGASHMSTSATAQDIYIEGSVTGDSVSATITAGTTDGQRMTLLGRSDTKTVTLNSTTTNVALNGPITMGAGDVIELRWDTTNWQEMNRS